MFSIHHRLTTFLSFDPVVSRSLLLNIHFLSDFKTPWLKGVSETDTMQAKLTHPLANVALELLRVQGQNKMYLLNLDFWGKSRAFPEDIE